MNMDLAIVRVESRPAAYVLRSSKTDYYYKGSCRNLDERLKDHRAGRVGRTKNHRPLVLVHYEYFDSYRQARKRENYFKSGSGREWLNRHFQLLFFASPVSFEFQIDSLAECCFNK